MCFDLTSLLSSSVAAQAVPLRATNQREVANDIAADVAAELPCHAGPFRRGVASACGFVGVSRHRYDSHGKGLLWTRSPTPAPRSSPSHDPRPSRTSDFPREVVAGLAVQRSPSGCYSRPASAGPGTRVIVTRGISSGSLPYGHMSAQRVPGGVVQKSPADLRTALIANTTALDAWKDITPLARNEFICWVEDAKQETTRTRRIRRTQEELEEGQRRPCCWPGCDHRERTGS